MFNIDENKLQSMILSEPNIMYNEVIIGNGILI